MLPVFLATNSTDRGSTSRTLEAWVRLFRAEGVLPFVSVGGPGPLEDALAGVAARTWVRGLRRFPSRAWPIPYLWAVLRLTRAIRASGALVVHLNEHEFQRVAAHAARLAGVPIVTHIRFRPDRAHCEWLFRPPYAPARVFFTSETQMHDCEEAMDGIVARDRWRLVYNGLDLSRYGRDTGLREVQRSRLGLRPSTVALGVACAISPRKRLDHFIRLVGRLRERGFDVRGFVAGVPSFRADDALYQDLQNQARVVAGDAVQFLGYVEPSEPLYHAWDICVSTSSYESFGMTVLEAMACGCAVVAYPGGAVAEVAREGGILVADGDEKGLFDACARLCTDRMVREQQGTAGRARAEAFDVRKSVALLAAEYRQVVAERPAAGAR